MNPVVYGVIGKVTGVGALRYVGPAVPGWGPGARKLEEASTESETTLQTGVEGSRGPGCKPQTTLQPLPPREGGQPCFPAGYPSFIG